MAIDIGLEGVVAAETAISEVDGLRGDLILRGARVEALAGRATFEAALVRLHGLEATEDDVRRRLGAARVAAYEAIAVPPLADGMDALRGALATLPSGIDPVAAVAVAVAGWARPGVAPDPRLSHAADVLRMLTGATDPARVSALETYLVTVMDHGMNASTFTARVIASTGSDTLSAIVGAVGALKGPLHGGAPGPVLDLLDRIGSPERAEAVLRSELEAGRRIMGMGHRVYRVRDPRAAVLEAAVRRLREAGIGAERLELARAVEETAERLLAERHPARALRANVEFYTAVLLDAIGLARTLFTPAFAIGRVVGWTAHVAEQRSAGRLIRPSSRYVGPRPDAI